MTKHVLHGMDIDEVSLVDVPANQLSAVEITKAHRPDREGLMPRDDTTDPVELSLDEAQPGDIAVLEDGTEVVLTQEMLDELAEEVEEHANAGEPAPVGKSFNPSDIGVGEIAAQVRTELAKAFTEDERDEVVSKLADTVDVLAKRARNAEDLAKALVDRELEGKYTDVAKAFGIPGVAPEALGPVLKRAAETLDDDDLEVLAKALKGAGDGYRELGGNGAGSPLDPDAMIESYVQVGGDVSKAAEGLTKAQRIAKAFEMSPDAYDAYLDDREG